MSIGREESLFLTVSEDHRKRTYPEYVQKMSEPFEHAGGMVEVYEGVVLGGADKFFGLDDLNLWLRRHRYAAYDMDVLLPIAHLCVERAVRAKLMGERPGVAVMAEQAAGEILRGDLLRYRRSSRGWMYIYDLTKQFPAAATEGDRRILKNFSGFEDMLAEFDYLAARSESCADAKSLVELAALLYRKIFIRYFAPDHNQDILPERETEEWEPGSRTIELSAEPEKDENGEYRLGAWVRDSMAGIGTMTFYDPQSGTFGALGHGVTDVDTGQLLPLDHGSIMDASVKAVKKGERASPGELKGDFDLTRDSGTLYANTECGIFGKLSAEDAAKITGAALPIAKKDEIKTGRAAILATVSGNETREYDIEIEKIYSPSGSTRNLLLRVTDEELLAQTGGVVQGMSGSAILQDGKIIGAVTHVLLDDPSRGYGIFIENMLSAAGLSSE